MGRVSYATNFKLCGRSRHSRLNAAVSSVLMLCIALLPFTGHAFEGVLEKELQTGLEQSRAIIISLQSKLRSGDSPAQEITRLKNTADNITITHLLLQERFRLREERATTLGSSALERQQAMAEGYRQALTEYLNIINGLPSDASLPQSAIRNLQSLLKTILPGRKRPIIGSLPYKHLNLPAIEPTTAPAITPAYKGGNKIVSQDDTAAAPEAPISKEIASLAQSLGWNPVSIYEYVKNNVETEWYWGCMKGAEDTLHQKSGNDCDQAALLVSLLRASGYPTRYVRGVIEFFPDIERAKHLLGIDNPSKIAEFFQKAGIPSKPIIQGGKIANFQIEHIWVESQIPYSNYRGAVIDEHGKAWLGLDTSIKVKGYEYGTAKDIYELSALSGQLTAISDEYLGLVQSDPTYSVPAPMTVTPLDYFKAKLSAVSSQHDTELTADSYKLTRTLLPEIMNILPASLQFGLVKVTNEYAAVPDELKHKVKLSAVSSQMSANSGKLFDITLDAMKLSNQQIALSYEPETVQDQEIIDSFGGLDNTPAYLVRLRPVLKVNGERTIVATDGLPMGADLELSIEQISPNGTEKISNTLIVGNLTVIGITSQKAVLTPSPLAGEGGGLPSNASIGGEGAKDAERLLYESAQHYIDRWNKAEEEFASLLHLNIARPIPAIVTVGGVIDVSYLLDMPHGFTWKGVYVDADLRRIETVESRQSAVVSQSSSEKTKLFMQLSSLQGSVLEHRLFEDDFQVESISTAKLLQLAASQTTAGIVTIDSSNIDTVLPSLTFDQNIKEDIINSVNRKLVIRIPQSETLYNDWTGAGYIKENTESGESGWMLSGMIAGGMTAVKKELWINQDKAAILELPNTLPPNLNPGSAVRLVRVSDYLTGFAGSVLDKTCQTRALDASGRPVPNVPVIFRVIEGGGKVQGVDKFDAVLPNLMNNSTMPSPVYSVMTGTDGIARVKVTLGERTDASPFYRQVLAADNKQYWELVGLNMVTMSAQGGAGAFSTEKPFEAYGRAGAAAKIEVVSPRFTAYGHPNMLFTTAWIKVVDQYGNSISGKNVNFYVERTFLGPNPGPDAKTARLYAAEADCPGIAILSCPLANEYSAADPLAQVSEHYGAMAYVIIGNTANTLFTVKAAAKKDTFDSNDKRIDTAVPMTPAAMAYQTYPRDSINPDATFTLSALIIYHYDEQGNWTDGGLVDRFFPEDLALQMFYHEEGYESVPDSNGFHYLKGTGVFTTRMVTDGEVNFKRIQGDGLVSTPVSTAGPDGLYTTKYKFGPDPALNLVEAFGTATVLRPLVDPASGAVTTPEVNLSTSAFFNIWGVKPAVEPNQLIMINSEGYPVTDTEVRFTVLPEGYKYSTTSLYLYFYEKDTLGNESWMGFVQADPTGKIILTWGGVKFNPAYTYSVQLIVDRGKKKELMSEKIPIPVAQLNVITDEGANSTKAEEIKFGDGSKANKRYRIELKMGTPGCTGLNSLPGAISTILKSGQTPTPAGADYYPAQYELALNPSISGCSVKVNNKLKFIVSNLSKTDLQNRNSLPSDAEVIYGGLGGRERVELGGAKLEIPIEPVGVIVLAIDGLRQDVLYPPQNTEGADATASYADPTGCGGSCYVDPNELKGLCDVLGGKYDDGILGYFDSCDPAGWDTKHIKLKDVTAIFPSITVASWASVFTGKMPGRKYDANGTVIEEGTGILGNEFFARDLLNSNITWNPDRENEKIRVPDRYDNPAGMITFSSGALRGYDAFGFIPKFTMDFFIPYQGDWKERVLPERTPQNDMQLLTARTIYEIIEKDLPEVTGYFKTRSGDASVVANNHYARGAYWLTWDVAFKWGESAIMDDVGWDKFEDYLGNGVLVGKYDKLTDNGLQRNSVPFSAVTTWYLPGLDHQAHIKGMGAYTGYFTSTTDDYVKKLVSRLKKLDEFDNKIFITVADHGMTAMPEDLMFVPSSEPDSLSRPAEMSCKLVVDGYNVSDVREAEQANNNLHIWELGEVLRAVGDSGGTQYKVLAPKPIANLYFARNLQGELYELPYGATSDINKANVIAALNGPMAHIYFKRAGSAWGDGDDDPSYIVQLTKLAKDLKNYLINGGVFIENERIKKDFKNLLFSVDRILIRVGGVYKDFKGVQLDASDNVIGPLADTISETYFDANKYVDAFNRIKGMNHVKRSGDIILIMKDAVDIPVSEIANNRFTTGVACKSWHGSMNRSDSHVPFIVAYPGGNKFEIQPIIDITQGCNSTTGCDGNWRVTDLIKTIVKKQFGSQ